MTASCLCQNFVDCPDSIGIKPVIPPDDRNVSHLGFQEEEDYVEQGFPVLAALKERLLEFIDYFNRTFAQPFRWTCTDLPATTETAKGPAT